MAFSTPKKNASGHYVAIAQERRLVQLDSVTLFSSDENTNTVALTETELAKVGEVDAFVIQSAKDNCQEWFSKSLAEKTIEAAYTRTGLTMNAPCHPGGVKYYRNRQETEAVKDTNGVLCDVVLEFSGVLFSKKNFRSIWKLVQVRFRPEPKMRQKYEEYLFQGDGEDVLSEDDGDDVL
jgi:hypothetical protein